MSTRRDAARVLMVCTREIPDNAESGRERTMAFIRGALAAGGHVDTLRLTSLLEDRSIRRAAEAVLAGLWGLLRGRPVPLQSLLFHDRRFGQRLVAAVASLQPSAVYFDGVRSGMHAPELRNRFARLRLVCDFDDLMSRRMQMLAAARQPISMGYLKKLVPGWVQRHVLDGLLGRALQTYEQRALQGAERRIMAACDKVVLVSAVDAAHLRADWPQAPVVVIPPVMPPMAPGAASDSAPLQVRRFVFIGSDTLLQNRQSIEFLVALWKRVLPRTPLHIFGKQSGTYDPVPGLQFHGFIADLAAAYEPGSVLLAPSFLGGGVKTKVLEAMSYGVVPIGTHVTFEGIEAQTQGLVFEAGEWAALVSNPEQWRQRLEFEGRRAIGQAARAHSLPVLSARWRSVVWPAGAGATEDQPAAANAPASDGTQNRLIEGDPALYGTGLSPGPATKKL